MIGFLIKKNFFDLWDNLFRVALLNLGFIASMAIPVFLPTLLAGVPVLGLGVLFIGILWCFVYLSAAALCVKSISDYGAFGFADFFASLKIIWPLGLIAGALVFVCYLLITMVIPFYLAMNSMVGLLLAAVIFWTLVVGALSLQFFFAVRSRLDTKITKIIKKCFIIFFDNPGFALFVFLSTILMLAISVFLAFLFPGPAGILLYQDEALRLRLFKYDWLEANPEANRKQIPWDAILIDERERTGTRSLKSFIFPWKD
ncbi:hypothetical protein [Leadbettera azotonutricia]|uniref:DUF975 family protein n=1 Tax=Leadbettera azotonutricia (strain ATCC BAA-888 / DSM 13862 / ZAS-9) TaxID=545695 RepID=F5Y6Q3_LEAAZ|nr:hypothetical protein [Leadbettera azotonutricia]AEF80672.1 hypothetical protein TREAZ_1217 [Leadbettera azotonutricia ZAS-9]